MLTRVRFGLLTLSSFLALSSVSIANDLIYRMALPSGSPPRIPCCKLRDLDGDGRADFAFAAGWNHLSGQVRIVSGVDGSLIRVVAESIPYFGRSLANAGDVNLDGYEDLIIGAATLASIHSGRDGSRLYRVKAIDDYDNYAYAVSGIDDVTGDGRPDLVVGAPQMAIWGGGDVYHGYSVGSGYAEVRSGQDGSLVRVLQIGSGTIAFGGSVSPIGDLDLDGVGDIAVSSFMLPAIGLSPSVRVAVFSGATGSLVWETLGRPGQTAPIGDVDGDGRADVLVADPLGEVRVLAGSNGAVVWERTGLGFTSIHLGIPISPTGDLNGDGAADVILGQPQPTVSGGGAPGSADMGPGFARVLSGRDGSTLSTIVGKWIGYQLGSQVLGLGNVDGDGFFDLGIFGYAPTPTGSVVELRVYSGDPRNSAPLVYCPSNANSARIGWSGTTSLAANNLGFSLTGATPGQLSVLECSAEATVFGYGSSLSATSWRCLDGTLFRLAPFVTTDASGNAGHALDVHTLPAGMGPITAGSTWNFQFWYRSPGAPWVASRLSDALAVTFRP